MSKLTPKELERIKRHYFVEDVSVMPRGKVTVKLKRDFYFWSASKNRIRQLNFSSFESVTDALSKAQTA